MKKSRLLFIALCVLSMVLVAVSFVACNKNDTNKETQDDIVPGEYETATYKVTYDTNGADTENSSWKEKTYSYGDKVLKPTYTPVKIGYVFLYWSESKTGSEFNFNESSIISDMTLYAVYSAKTVRHNYDLTATLENNDGVFSINTNTYTYGQMPSQTTVLETQYGSAASTLVVPYCVDAPKVNDADDRFCFWYYLDKDDKPVRFTTVANSSSTSVTVLNAYNSSEPLTLYPMWLSTLPSIEVTFKDTKTEFVYGTLTARYNEVIDKALNPIQDKTGYTFSKWTYQDSNDATHNFYFDDTDDSEVNATTISDMVDYDYFNSKSITVYANWIKKVSVSDVSSFENIYNTIRIAEPTDAQKADIEELLNSHIEFTSIDFSGKEYEPLFDKDHVFKGIIEGNNAGDPAVFSNYTAKGTDNVSIFGYVQGSIKNINVTGALLKIEDEHASSILVGGLVSVLSSPSSDQPGLIWKCNVDFSISISGEYDEIVFGGIVAENGGRVQLCESSLSSVNIEAKVVTFGGITANSRPSSSILESKATLPSVTINATSKVVVGGLAGNNNGSITASQSNITISSITSSGLVFGGLVANNTSKIEKSIATVNFGEEASPLDVKASATESVILGGLIGKNSGQLLNSRTMANIFANSINDGGKIFVGGLVGENTSVSSSSSSGQVNYVYADGSIVVSVPDGHTTETAVGGLIGRNTQTNITSCFSLMDVKVTNKAGNNKVGYMMGINDSIVTIYRILYASENSLVKNDVAYSLETKGEYTVLTEEKDLAEGNFKEESTIFGTTGTVLKFDRDIWEIKSGLFPTLKWEA